MDDKMVMVRLQRRERERKRKRNLGAEAVGGERVGEIAMMRHIPKSNHHEK